jgi:O-antigen/teichoic acid export membrane protein
MIGWIRTEEEVGYYFAANQLIRKLLPLITATGAVLLSKITQLKNEGDREKIKFYLTKSLSLIWIVAFPMAIGTFLLANDIILLLFGKLYYPSVLTLKILAPIIFLISLSNIYRVQILLPFKREKTFTFIIIAGALTNFTLNLILIKNYGHNGAAFSSLTAEILVVLLDLVFVYKMFPHIHNLKEILQVILSTAFMSLYIIITQDYFNNLYNFPLGLLLLIFSSVIIYLFLLIIQKNNTLHWILKDKLLKKLSEKLHL